MDVGLRAPGFDPGCGKLFFLELPERSSRSQVDSAPPAAKPAPLKGSGKLGGSALDLDLEFPPLLASNEPPSGANGDSELSLQQT